ncbi:MAG: hypothetical protein QG578_2122, partial [Thermodesulfobacteriota bacterium]|nr:hypothetical protein [Thermodesulfobacteriota bacterium]
CGNTKTEKDKRKPGIKLKSLVKIHTDCKSDKYRKRHLQAETAVIRKFPYISSCFSFQKSALKYNYMARTTPVKLLPSNI